jgi:hypothetical protein
VWKDTNTLFLSFNKTNKKCTKKEQIHLLTSKSTSPNLMCIVFSTCKSLAREQLNRFCELFTRKEGKGEGRPNSLSKWQWRRR